MNGPTFLAYVKQQLVPTLSPGDIVVMDNLASHKVPGVREAIAAVGAEVVYLPPYCPDPNPIELVFSKLKRLLRSAGHRTIEDLWHVLGQALDHFPPDECTRDLKHCGHNATPQEIRSSGFVQRLFSRLLRPRAIGAAVTCPTGWDGL